MDCGIHIQRAHDEHHSSHEGRSKQDVKDLRAEADTIRAALLNNRLKV